MRSANTVDANGLHDEACPLSCAPAQAPAPNEYFSTWGRSATGPVVDLFLLRTSLTIGALLGEIDNPGRLNPQVNRGHFSTENNQKGHL